MTFIEITRILLEGFLTTVLLFISTYLLSIPLGGVFAYLRLSKNKIISNILKFIIWVIRGTPLMLQIMVIFYVPGLIFNVPNKSRILSVVIALSINYAIYFAEIYRSGFESIPKGQFEASYALGLSKKETFFKIILLQIIKKIIPPMSNETISLVKDTALARIISVTEIIYAAQKIVSTYAIIWVLFYIAIFYLLFNGLLTILLSKFERKLSYIGD